MSDSALYITLGHNSSAVFARDGVVVCGYEQERIDRKKSSSAYPREAIDLCLEGQAFGVDVAYVSHWFDDLTLQSNKYLDLEHLRSVVDCIISVTESFTHHDAHASSALSFFRANGGKADDVDIVVMDGFGTHRECFSVYQSHWPLNQYPRLVHRNYGYENSLGLMYQYVTQYLGMKPNRDEYKLLGYEARILDYVPRAHALMVQSAVADQAEAHVKHMIKATERPEWTGGLIDLEALKAAKAKWWEMADVWRKMFKDVDEESGIRTCVAFCAQTFLEYATLRLIDHAVPVRQGPQPHVLLTGGCFYNVKLNRRIQLDTQRRVFSHPLAGDQGAALGFTPGVNPLGLTWGTRAIGERSGLPPGVELVDEGSWVSVASRLLERDRIVNVVRGGMEFGPRALCNTTTLALPTKENVSRINQLNERDDAMPMAPVMTRRAAMRFFRHDELLDVPVSDRFMITTVAFAEKPDADMMGVAHNDPLSGDVFTARPQVVDGGAMTTLLRDMPDETLINTSFNYHGEPIVFTEDDACRTHDMQSFRAKTLGIEPPITLLVRS